MCTYPSPLGTCEYGHRGSTAHPAASPPRVLTSTAKGFSSVGVEIRVEHLTKRFGRQTIWEDVSLTLPAGEISVLLGPSGTG